MAQRSIPKRKKISTAESVDGFRQVALATLGSNIRSRREAVTNQEEFAALAGLARGYYGSLERGEHNVAVLNLLKIAVALDCEPAELMPTLSQLKAAVKR